MSLFVDKFLLHNESGHQAQGKSMHSMPILQFFQGTIIRIIPLKNILLFDGHGAFKVTLTRSGPVGTQGYAVAKK